MTEYDTPETREEILRSVEWELTLTPGFGKKRVAAAMEKIQAADDPRQELRVQLEAGARYTAAVVKREESRREAKRRKWEASPEGQAELARRKEAQREFRRVAPIIRAKELLGAELVLEALVDAEIRATHARQEGYGMEDLPRLYEKRAQIRETADALREQIGVA